MMDRARVALRGADSPAEPPPSRVTRLPCPYISFRESGQWRGRRVGRCARRLESGRIRHSSARTYPEVEDMKKIEVPQPQPIEEEDLSQVAGGGEPDQPLGPRTE